MGVTIVAFQALGVGTAMPAIARELGGLAPVRLELLAPSCWPASSARWRPGERRTRPGRRGPTSAPSPLFAAGSVVGALAGSWGVLLAGACIQGSAWARSSSWSTCPRAARTRPSCTARMLALMSTAWVLPSLVGPGAGRARRRPRELALGVRRPAAVAARGHRAHAARPAHARPARGRRRPRGSLAPALVLAAGRGRLPRRAGAARAALPCSSGAARASPLGARAARGCCRRAPCARARGLPAGIAVRGLVAVAFLGGDAFMPLALDRSCAGSAPRGAGGVITAASLSWSLGAFAQARLDRRDGGARAAAGARGSGSRSCCAGLAVGAVGVLIEALPVALAVVGWTIAGLRHRHRLSLGRRARAGPGGGGRGGARLRRPAARRDRRRGAVRGHRRRAHRPRAGQRVGRGHGARAGLLRRRRGRRRRAVGRAPDGEAPA